MTEEIDNCTRITLIQACKTIGDGNISSGVDIVKRIGDRLRHARGKHPVFATRREDAQNVVMDEVTEWVNACLLESKQRQDDEAFDIIATLIRDIRQEYEGKEDE